MTASTDYRLGWMASLRGRVGVAVTPAAARLCHRRRSVRDREFVGNGVGLRPRPVPRRRQPCDIDTFRFGWAVGAELESRLFGNWTGQVEYLHVDLGSFRATPNMAAGMATSFDSDARVRTDTVRVGVNYKFATTTSRD